MDENVSHHIQEGCRPLNRGARPFSSPQAGLSLVGIIVGVALASILMVLTSTFVERAMQEMNYQDGKKDAENEIRRLKRTVDKWFTRHRKDEFHLDELPNGMIIETRDNELNVSRLLLETVCTDAVSTGHPWKNFDLDWDQALGDAVALPCDEGDVDNGGRYVALMERRWEGNWDDDDDSQNDMDQVEDFQARCHPGNAFVYDWDTHTCVVREDAQMKLSKAIGVAVYFTVDRRYRPRTLIFETSAFHLAREQKGVKAVSKKHSAVRNTTSNFINMSH